MNQIVTPQDVSIEGWQKFRHDSLFLYSGRSRPLIFPSRNVESKTTIEQTLKGLAAGKGPFTRWAVTNRRYMIPEKLEYRELTPSRFEIKIKADGPVFLITRITYFHCWKVRAFFEDGRSASLPVNQVDLAFVGMELPPGVEKIILYYESSVNVYVLSLWSCFVLVLCFFSVRMRMS